MLVQFQTIVASIIEISRVKSADTHCSKVPRLSLEVCLLDSVVVSVSSDMNAP